MILETLGLAKSFSGIRPVDGINLKIEEGEVSSIIGPNGAGKTTLFNLITGRIHCDAGRIFFKGDDITNATPRETSSKGIGRCFQVTSIFPAMTVFDNVQISAISRQHRVFNLYSSADSMLRSDVFSILKLVGLYEEAATIAGSLSYGIQRRLELAITLALKPKLLLLDEPTGGVAPKEANELMELVTSLVREQGLTAVFIEHDMNVVFNFSEKIRVMHLGRIIVEGTPMEVRNNREVQNIYLGEVGS